MKQDGVLKLLATQTKELQALGVQSLAVFGSVVHEEAGPDSDVDILVEFAKPVGFFAFLEVKERLEKLLGCPVDLVTRKALHPRLRDKILSEAVYAR
jgi:predicted nucleotidyltransferase